MGVTFRCGSLRACSERCGAGCVWSAYVLFGDLWVYAGSVDRESVAFHRLNRALQSRGHNRLGTPFPILLTSHRCQSPLATRFVFCPFFLRSLWQLIWFTKSLFTNQILPISPCNTNEPDHLPHHWLIIRVVQSCLASLHLEYLDVLEPVGCVSSAN